MAGNILQQAITPVKPKVIEKERIFVYVEEASAKVKGIASYNSNHFLVNAGNVRLNTDYLSEAPFTRASLIKLADTDFVLDNDTTKINWAVVDNKIDIHNTDETAHPYLLEQLDTKIELHNTDETAHPFILNELNKKVNKRINGYFIDNTETGIKIGYPAPSSTATGVFSFHGIEITTNGVTLTDWNSTSGGVSLSSDTNNRLLLKQWSNSIGKITIPDQIYVDEVKDLTEGSPLATLADLDYRVPTRCFVVGNAGSSVTKYESTIENKLDIILTSKYLQSTNSVKLTPTTFTLNNKNIALEEYVDNSVSQRVHIKPDGSINLINPETGKIDNAYIPVNVGNGRKYAGAFSDNGIIVGSQYFSELSGQNINDIDIAKCTGAEFIYVGTNPFDLTWKYRVKAGPDAEEVEYTGILHLNANDVVLCNGETIEELDGWINYNARSWVLLDNSDKVTSVNGQTGAVNLTIPTYDDLEQLDKDARKVLILGGNGTIGINVNFVIEDAESFIGYRNNLTEFIMSLIVPVTGEVDLTKEVTIDFGDTSYYLFDAVDTSRRLTLGDLNFALRESLITGYNYLFKTVFFNNADNVGFAVLPDRDQVLSLNSDQMDNYMADGGLPNGQLAICSKVITNGYTEGSIYRFKITYPSTYEWEELSTGGSGGSSATVITKVDGELVTTEFKGVIELTKEEYDTLVKKGTVTLSNGKIVTYDNGTIYVSDGLDLIQELTLNQSGTVISSLESFNSHVHIMIEFETDGMHYGTDFVLHPYDSSICLVSYNFVGHTGTAYLDENGYVKINVPDSLTFTNIKGHYMDLGG